MKPIGVIFNPFAKLNKKQTSKQFGSIKEILSDYALVRSTNSKDEIQKVVREFHESDIKILCISGGDGTISTVLTAYINLHGEKDLPLLVPLRGGAMNFISADAGLSLNQIAVCNYLVRIMGSNKPLETIERGLIKIFDQRFDHPYYSFTWVDGFLYRFMKWYYKGGGGTSVALKLIIKTFIMFLTNLDHDLFRQVNSSVSISNKRLPFESHLFITAASVKRLVFGFRAFSEQPKAGEKFNIIYMRLPYLKKVPYKIPIGLYWSLNSDESGNFLNLSTDRVKIEGNRGYVIDGEVIDSERPIDLKLEVGPTLKILSLNGNPK